VTRPSPPMRRSALPTGTGLADAAGPGPAVAAGPRAAGPAPAAARLPGGPGAGKSVHGSPTPPQQTVPDLAAGTGTPPDRHRTCLRAFLRAYRRWDTVRTALAGHRVPAAPTPCRAAGRTSPTAPTTPG
jgi:hypothetical protein